MVFVDGHFTTLLLVNFLWFVIASLLRAGAAIHEPWQT